MAATGGNDCRRKANFTFIWNIQNVSEIGLIGCVQSPTFRTEPIGNFKWVASIRIPFDEETMELGIRRTDCKGPDNIEIEFELSILLGNGIPFEMQTSKKQFKDGDECWLQFKNSHKYVSEKLVPFSPLTVRCRMWKNGTEAWKSDTCFARTRLAMDKRCFVWDIREFSSLQMGQKRTHLMKPSSIGSPTLILGAFLTERNGKTFLNISVTKKSDVRCPFVFCDLSLLDNDGKVVHSKQALISNINLNSQNGYTIREFFEKEKLVDDECSSVHSDVLYIRCVFLNEADIIWNRIEHYTHFESKKTERLDMYMEEQDESCTTVCLFKKAFEDLYGDESLSDVSLRAGTTSLPAHKTILSARSPVFRAMFSQDMREKTSKVVEIPDFNADTLRRFLLYIYKNTVEELQWEAAMDLYRVADKYQLLNLRKKCSLYLESNLAMINVCSILSLGVMHEDGDLQNAAEDFISEHDEVFDSVEWKNFREENFRLAFEIMEKIIRLIKRKNH